jgi:hypothetical protein
MRKTFSRIKLLQAARTGLATAVVLILVSSPITGSADTKSFTSGASGRTPEVAARAPQTFVPEFFDGGGSGPTPEVAVQAAIDDARVTASAYGLFTCELAGEPQVFPRPPGSFRAFSAQVRMHCTT